MLSFVFLQMKDPEGIANWSVTYVDWSEGKWHPRAYRAEDITYDLLKNITVCCNVARNKDYFIFLVLHIAHLTKICIDFFSLSMRVCMLQVTQRYINIFFSN